MEEVTVIADMTITATGEQGSAVAKINERHRLAITCAGDAVGHAIECGRLLIEQQNLLLYGEFGRWLDINCQFKRATATRYMAAAKKFATGVAIESLSSVFPSGRKSLPAPESVPAAKRNAPTPPAAPTTPPSASPSGMTLDQAVVTIRRQRNFVQKYGHLLQAQATARKELERAEIAHRNAITSIIRAASKIEAQARAEAK